MANASGGQLIVGVREPDRIFGVRPSQLKTAYRRAMSRIHPTPPASLESVDMDGRKIGVITIPKSSELVLTDNRR